jgi:ubiquitin C-terminal hydrolase
LYLATELIQEWRCPACKQNRRATKKFDIWRLPPILVIHFKRSVAPFTIKIYFEIVFCQICRFCEDIAWRKQHTLVEFPLHRLMMSPYTKRPTQKHNTYNLYAVSNHYGTMDGGHYTTYSYSKEFKK